MRPFIVLVVTEPMGVHAVAAARYIGSIPEMYDHLVAYLGADNRAQYPKPLRLGFWVRKRAVGVLHVAGLWEDVAIGPGIWDRAAVDEILVAGREVPNHILGLEVIVAGPPTRWG